MELFEKIMLYNKGHCYCEETDIDEAPVLSEKGHDDSEGRGLRSKDTGAPTVETLLI